MRILHHGAHPPQSHAPPPFARHVTATCAARAGSHNSRKTPMPRAIAFRCVVALMALAPLPGLAQSAFTTQAVNMRAGPDRMFPLVTWLPAGRPVTVIGCTSGWRWCDVVDGPFRGWVYSRYLSGPVRSRAPVITFSVGSYWGAHYQGRPWFGSQPSWNNWGSPGWRPPPQRRPPNTRPPNTRPPNTRPPNARPPGRPPEGPPNFGPPPAGDRPGQGGNRPPGGRPPSDGSSGGARPPRSAP